MSFSWSHLTKSLTCRSDSVDLSGSSESQFQHNGPFAMRYTMDINSGEVLQEQMADCVCEFPTVVPQLLGRNQQFAYLMKWDDNTKKRGFDECVV